MYGCTYAHILTTVSISFWTREEGTSKEKGNAIEEGGKIRRRVRDSTEDGRESRWEWRGNDNKQNERVRILSFILSFTS